MIGRDNAPPFGAIAPGEAVKLKDSKGSHHLGGQQAGLGDQFFNGAVPAGGQ